MPDDLPKCNNYAMKVTYSLVCPMMSATLGRYVEGAEMKRSELRIPKLRTRGKENRRRLLAEAERLMLENSGSIPKFSDVFEAAGVSRGSAYRIYIGVDDLMQDLATEWINNFVAFLNSINPDAQPENWMEVSDYLVKRGAEYWTATADTIQILPRIRSNVPASQTHAVRTLSECLSDIFNRYFDLPEIPGWMSKLAFYTEIGDITFSDAIRDEGHISEERRIEAQVLCRTYLAFHLPAELPARTRAQS